MLQKIFTFWQLDLTKLFSDLYLAKFLDILLFRYSKFLDILLFRYSKFLDILLTKLFLSMWK